MQNGYSYPSFPGPTGFSTPGTPSWVLRPTNAESPPALPQQQQQLQQPRPFYPAFYNGGTGGHGGAPNGAGHLVDDMPRFDMAMPALPAAPEAPSGNGGGSAALALAGLQTNEDCGIKEVWTHNLEEEFRKICYVVRDFPYVAMDTEFPGVVARPIGEFKSTADYQYQLLKCNVDLLKMIQLGLTFMDSQGNLPDGAISTWQFNFKFNLTEDMYAEESVGLLQNSGIQFEKHEMEGIDPVHFAELLIASGLVLRPEVKWLSFHAGYDFGYLVNLLTNQDLPSTESDFFETLKLFCPNIYDVKYLMKSCKNLKGGLQEVATGLEVARVGPQHQAGSDSLLTGQTFFKMKELFFEDDIDDSKYCGHLYGLGTSYVVTSIPVAPVSLAMSSSSSSLGGGNPSANGAGSEERSAQNSTQNSQE